MPGKKSARNKDIDVIVFKNDIIARALMDILQSGKESSKIRDQITAILTTYHTEYLNLEYFKYLFIDCKFYLQLLIF